MKTLPLLIANGLIFLLLSTSLIPPKAAAKTITLGEIELSGTFTLNPGYSFNQPTLQPFGSFSDLTLVEANGIFTPLLHHGDALLMTTPFVLSPAFSAPVDSKPLSGQMIWSIGGYTIDTTWTNITGADFAGRDVFGLFDLSGHQFDHQGHTRRAFGFWDFTAPPYDISNFTQPVTGPISLTISETFETGNAGRGKSVTQKASKNGHVDSQNSTTFEALNTDHAVPEPTSLLLVSIGLAFLLGMRSRRILF